jgi:hypothetical protein
VRRSHELSIPQFAGQARPEPDEIDSEGEALHTAVAEMVAIYNAARAQGLTPDPSWLKPNQNFS